ncbi:SDR family oxidoreductase [Deinococcus sedimenti]|uniref:dTDP-4-rhamnose reductase n=1 Tax=Deinococcus sedimenti TaxID=1867090 RepID=A0ABQ2S764_9DEIO|nr:NAD(P)-dependent oxidoreductase [Deinococcus sedimenti]GGR93389.1 dTDP-4-rhamnose reductase [Deinococcus sedimenti]
MILLTGGSGRLGQALQALVPGMICPDSRTLDVTCPGSVERAVQGARPDVIVHAAAFTDVQAAQARPAECWNVNVNGTRWVAQAAQGVHAKLVFISTDYVFDGRRGQYREHEPPGIPTTFYGLSKLVAEEAARACADHLIVRTSFRSSPFPHPVAFTDQFTSQDYVDVIAPELALLITRARALSDAVLHVGTERKSVYDLARRRSGSVRPGRRAEASLSLPADVSLDVTRWRELKAGWGVP